MHVHLTASVIFSALCNLVASTFSPCNYKYATRGLHQLPFPSPHLHQTLCGLPPHSPNLHSLCPTIPILAPLSSTHLPLSEHQARWHLAAHGGTARGQRRRCTCGRQFSSSTRSSAWSLSPPSSTLPPWLPSSWKSLWPSTLLSSSVWLSRLSSSHRKHRRSVIVCRRQRHGGPARNHHSLNRQNVSVCLFL